MANHYSHAALPYPIRNARYTIAVPYLDADGDPTDPTTPDTEISKDAGSFADCTEEVSTITGSNGMGYITLTSTEMDASLVCLAAKVASGPKATLAMLSPRILPVLHNGTAQAGANTSITLASGAPAYDLIGCIVRTTGGTGGGSGGNQARVITAYDTSTKVATVSPAWETNPSSDTTYDILLTDIASNNPVTRALRPATDGRTLNVASSGEAEADTVKVSGDSTAADNLEAACDGTGYNVGNGSVVAASVTGNVGGNVIGSVGSVVSTVAANLTQILGTALTETSGYIAAAFRKFFNVATPTGTVNSLPDAVPGAIGGVPTTNGSKLNQTADLTAGQSVGISGDFSATMKTSLNAATPASVTGAVGSVTGNVGGNVIGSVGSVAAGGITAASIATNAIDADAIAADAVTEIQSGLATASALATVDGIADAILVIAQKLDTMFELDGMVYRYTANALENAPTGTGGFTADDRLKVEGIYNKLPSKNYIAGTANADGDIQLNEATGTPADSAGVTTLLARVTGAVALASDMATLLSRISALRAGYLDNLSGGAVALDSEVGDILTIAQKLDTALEADGLVYRFTVNALENSPVGTGGFTATDRTHLETILSDGATLLKQNSMLDILAALSITTDAILIDADILQENLVPDTSINDRAKTEEDVITVYRIKTSGKRYRIEDL